MKRFWDKVDIRGPDECWPWMAACVGFPGSPGVFWLDGRNQGAHRVAWLLSRGGYLLSRHIIRHTCDSPPCCNPGHLLLGTQADNMRDKRIRGRACRGESSHLAKITEQDVREIRDFIRLSDLTQHEIGAMYGVSNFAVSDIKRGKSWGWLVP